MGDGYVEVKFCSMFECCVCGGGIFDGDVWVKGFVLFEGEVELIVV